MNELWLRRIAWIFTLVTLAVLAVAEVLVLLAPAPSDVAWWESLVMGFVTMGAPILGLVIVLRKPRNRYGWLWIAYALSVAIRTLSLTFFFFNHSQFSGYSSLGYFLLWLSEPANLAWIWCLILLILWYPDGQLPSRRWRFLYGWMLAATLSLALGLFMTGTTWNGAESAGGIVIENPFGWIPDTVFSRSLISFLAPLGFFSLVLISILAAVALLLRYRSARSLLRLQIRWFVSGSILFVILNFLPVFFISGGNSKFQIAISAIGFAAIIPLYLAVGIAVLRYRLYEIDIIIRKTLVYAALTVTLGLVFFGGVTLLQRVVGGLTGTEDSPVAIVLSTLAIAALFSPLRRRIQDFIDRRFYRRKYNAEQALADFAATARNETDLEALSGKLVEVVQETMQPERLGLWLKHTKNMK